MVRWRSFIAVSSQFQRKFNHSFIQSHINYCSLVWGFVARSEIDSLFCKQKKGIRTVVPGFINYKYCCSLS